MIWNTLTDLYFYLKKKKNKKIIQSEKHHLFLIDSLAGELRRVLSPLKSTDNF